MNEQTIRNLEERLRRAMLASDHAALDALISADLIFTNHLGQLLGKQDDLALHRAGLLRFSTLEPSEFWALPSPGLAIVSVRMKAGGTYAGTLFEADLRYTRVWRQSADETWQIVAGHSSAVQSA